MRRHRIENDLMGSSIDVRRGLGQHTSHRVCDGRKRMLKDEGAGGTVNRQIRELGNRSLWSMCICISEFASLDLSVDLRDLAAAVHRERYLSLC